MGKSNKRRPASLIKGYLPVRVKLPEPPVGSQDGHDETFFYVKEHREGNSKEGGNNNKGSSSTTLFIANAPIVRGVKTKIILKALFGRFGDIDRVTLVENPRKAAATAVSLSWASSDLEQFFPNFLPPLHGSEKFAHVVFTNSQEMRQTLKSLTEMMEDSKSKLPALELPKLELQMLKDETERLHREEMGEDEDDYDDNKKEEQSNGILALAQRYRSSVARLDREVLLEKCNEVMEDYEDSEEAQRLAREAAANQPDEDGFVTVVASSKGVDGGKQQLEKDQGAPGKRRRNQKRNRKKKDSIGATELQDFYRFQRKETRKRTLQDLRLQFEEDLKKVKKMKDEQQYKPF